jgi:hypothetical protein
MIFSAANSYLFSATDCSEIYRNHDRLAETMSARLFSWFRNIFVIKHAHNPARLNKATLWGIYLL